MRLRDHAEIAQQNHGGETVGTTVDQKLSVRGAVEADAPQLFLTAPPARQQHTLGRGKAAKSRLRNLSGLGPEEISGTQRSHALPFVISRRDETQLLGPPSFSLNSFYFPALLCSKMKRNEGFERDKQPCQKVFCCCQDQMRHQRAREVSHRGTSSSFVHSFS